MTTRALGGQVLPTRFVGPCTRAFVAVIVLGVFNGPTRSQLTSTEQQCVSQDAVVRGVVTMPPRCGQPCSGIELGPEQRCNLDVSDCEGGVRAGGVCLVKCLSPLVGPTTSAVCPGSNVNAGRQPLWNEPICAVPLDICEDEARFETEFPGYVNGEQGWECADGFAGKAKAGCRALFNEETGSCQQEFYLEGCKKRVPCALPPLDPCKIDAAECADVDAGGICIVRCKLPYVALSSAAACPPDNTDPDGFLFMPEPLCELTCPDPEPADVPRGYRKDPSVKEPGPLGWQCDVGYGGQVLAECQIRDDCSPWLKLSGCVPEEPCALPPHDRCEFDFAACINVMPNTTCPVRCKPPYFSVNTTSATCPAGNIDRSTPLIPQYPPCEIDVYQLEDLPIGYTTYPYVKTDGGWGCIGSYSGTVVVEYDTAEDCSLEMHLFGCYPLVRCQPPILDMTTDPPESCQYDVLWCLSVFSGYDCQVGCRFPYVGEPTRGFCPPNNTDPSTRLVWTRPQCVIVDCPPPPGGTPPGYKNIPGFGWFCDDKYYGEAKFECLFNNRCEAQVVLSGCLPLSPCRMPDDVEKCWMDWDDCRDGVYPGLPCTIPCRGPYQGEPGYASCPDMNLDPTRVMDFVLPKCNINCTDPTNMTTIPDGYEKPPWQCADGYGGRARTECMSTDDCRAGLMYSGCSKLRPCVLPQISLEDQCTYNVSSCDGLMPGQECAVGCGPHHVNVFGSTSAHCPLGNVDPTTELLWVRPRCEPQCVDPIVWPPGYRKNRRGCWICSPGYEGVAVATCQVNISKARRGGCFPELHLTGCFKVVGCAPPSQVGNATRCMIDSSDCVGVEPGGSCTVRCKAPYTTAPGGETTAFCPINNVDPLAEPLWTPPICDLICPYPDVVPTGFVSNGTDVDTWFCDAGYFGSAEATCEVSNFPACSPHIVLSGCLPLTDCMFPADMDRCKFDVSSCGDGIYMTPGTECEVTCKAPYSSLSSSPDPAITICPLENTNPTGGLTWSEPACFAGCSPTASQTGYRWTVSGFWQCDVGWIGTTIRKSCVTDEDCIVREMLSGCNKLQACAPLELTPEEQCVYDASLCDSLMAYPTGAASCRVQCKAPYFGFDSFAYCPEKNTDTTTPLEWFKGAGCQCPAPATMPAGYVFVDRGVGQPGFYKCADGYAGDIKTNCVVNGIDCSYQMEFSGCEKIVPCVPPNFTKIEQCMYNMTDCEGLKHGESCEVSCLPPFETLNVTVAYCPATNTDPFREYIMEQDFCGYDCNVPEVLPVGYAVGQWSCADGYRGEVHIQCGFLNDTELDPDPQENCSSEILLSGCYPLAPCAPPVLEGTDNCLYDVSDCQSVGPGEYCTIRCAAGAIGPSVQALCPPDNWDPMRSLVWVKPRCEPVCPQPAVVPVGYMLTVACGWQCWDDYAGVPTLHCELNSTVWAQSQTCHKDVWLTGCTKTQNCAARAPEEYDVCKYNISDCEDGPYVPGYSCTVSCLHPWASIATTQATCDIDNIVLDQPINWSAPDPPCWFDCEIPDDPPEGYAYDNATGWYCTGQHAGTAVATCTADRNADCANSLVFTGCLPKQPCAPPSVSDQCLIDVSLCSSVYAGTTCEVRCLAPVWQGTPTIATCPADNTDPNFKLVIVEPQCSLDCPPPVFEMLAYTRNFSGPWNDWRCAENAIGEANAWCYFKTDECGAYTELSGCDLLRDCEVPAELKCRLAADDCENLMYGETCEASCAPQFVGGNITGSCPAENIIRGTPVAWSVTGDLSLFTPRKVNGGGDFDPSWCECPVLDPWPAGYRWDGFMWHCAENYTGSATEECSCSGQLVLSGCHLIVPCAPPSPTYLTNDTQCQSIYAGLECEADCLRIGCVAGTKVRYRCPELNINPAQRPARIAGSCQVRCEVCSTEFVQDLDPRQGVLTSNLTFGPAHAIGEVDLPEIVGYRLFFADSCGKELAQVAPDVPAVTYNPGCCVKDTYKVEANAVKIPPGTEHIEIRVITVYGELPFGKKMPFRDANGTSTGNGGDGGFRTDGTVSKHSASKMLILTVFLASARMIWA